MSQQTTEPRPVIYAERDEFQRLPRYHVSATEFPAIAENAGWKPGVAELLLRGGHQRPIKCGLAVYQIWGEG